MSAFSRKRKVQAPHTAAVDYLSRDLSNKIKYEVSEKIKDYKQELTKTNYPLAIRDINNELTALEEFQAWATYKNNLPPASLKEINVDIQGSSVCLRLISGLVALDKEKEIPDEFRTWTTYTNNLANRIAKAEENITLATLTHKIDDEVEICYELAHISERSVTVYIEQSFKLPKELTEWKLDKLAKRVLKMRSAKRSAYSAKLAKIKIQRREPKILREKKLNKILMSEHDEYLANLRKIKKELKQRWCKKVDEVMMQRRVERRRLNKLIRHDHEAIALHLGAVGGRGTNNKRCTNAARIDQNRRNANNERWLENAVVIGDRKEIIKLSDAAHNRYKQVCEIYCFAKGIETHGNAQGLRWASVVVTLPPQFHPNPFKGGNSWDGTLPTEAARTLQKQWRRLRACAAKHGVTLAGLRTVEAHQDGCPHINYLIYFNDGFAEQVEEWFKRYFGRGKRAVKFQLGKTKEELAEDYKNGIIKKEIKAASFATYAIKYFTKYFFDANDKNSVCEQAWASTWSIRRYSFIGIPQKSMWQKLRSQTNTPKDKETATLWRAARGGRAADFIALCGGLAIKNKNRPFRIYSVPHLKSRVPVGVENVSNGVITICKNIGYWRTANKNTDEARKLFARVQKKRDIAEERLLRESRLTVEQTQALNEIEAISNDNYLKPQTLTRFTQHKLTCGDDVTLILSPPSKTQTPNPEPQNLEKLPTETNKSPPVVHIKLEKHREAQQKRADTISHRAAAVAEIVKRRSVHPGYLYRMQMINADLAAIGQAPISGLDSIQ